MPLDEVLAAFQELNPKEHDEDGIAASLADFAFTEPGLLDERTERLIAGHGRYAALATRRDAGASAPDGVEVDENGTWRVPIIRGWASRDDQHAKAYLIASNRLTEAGGWDRPVLTTLLSEIADYDADLLASTGFNASQLEDMIADLAAEPASDEGDEAGEEPDERGNLLELAGVTVGEPTRTAAAGQVWALGDHRLIVAEVFDGWPVWRDFLTGEALFLPYPTLLAPFTEKARGRRLVLVQPETYLAGHLLDKWAQITGEEPQLLTGET